MASSAAPAPAHDLEFDHEVDDDFDPVFPPGFDPDQDIEFIHLDQPLEEPVAPIDPLFDDPADFDMDFVDAKLAVAPEPIIAPDPALEHDPDPVVAPFPAPMPVLFDRAPFATHVDPRYADTRNGWIDNDDDYPPFVRPVTPPVAPVSAPISAPTDIPLFPPHFTDAHRTYLHVMFLQDIPPPRPGGGSSRQPPVPVPPMMSSPFPFASQFPTVVPLTAPSFTPSSEPFLWTMPPIMPLSDPYHPYHVGYSTEDILTSLMIQQEALTRRIHELERAQRPPGHCQTPFAASHPPRLLSPESDVHRLEKLKKKRAAKELKKEKVDEVKITEQVVKEEKVVEVLDKDEEYESGNSSSSANNPKTSVKRAYSCDLPELPGWKE
ncbi:uncharacterized protein LOC110924516 [Helianthus annuus]|uniref:uncharacterized protein LOC110924516 n=1 Tax=Helianthus annuus TaxID=4232 RepID=UPI000B8F4479|nr:uncharacterized protein LOC110924516 [Helianthus annuus]